MFCLFTKKKKSLCGVHRVGSKNQKVNLQTFFPTIVRQNLVSVLRLKEYVCLVFKVLFFAATFKELKI